MIIAKDGFETYLKNHEKIIHSVIHAIGCKVPEDKEDLVVEAQGILWMVFNSPKKDFPKGYIRTILYNRLMDYLRETLPLSRSHLKAIKEGSCEKPIFMNDEALRSYSSSCHDQAIDRCIDITLLLESSLFQSYHKTIIKMSLENRSDQEIMKFLNITKSTLMVYRWEIRSIYTDNYMNS